MKANQKMIRLSYIPTLLVLLCSAVGAQTMGRMVTDIDVPAQDPYCDGNYDAITIDTENPLSCPRVTVDAVPEDVVDWVLLELRSTDTGDAAIDATDVIARKPAFLLSNGRVVDAARYAEQITNNPESLCAAENIEAQQTCPDVEFVELEEAADEDIYLVARHRNHLDIISANNITGVTDEIRNADIYSHDFSANDDRALGAASALKEKDPGIHVLYGGDVNRDGQVSITDYTVGAANDIGISRYRNGIEIPAYHNGDTNFSSIVTPADYSDIIANNLTQSSQVP